MQEQTSPEWRMMGSDGALHLADELSHTALDTARIATRWPATRSGTSVEQPAVCMQHCYLHPSDSRPIRSPADRGDKQRSKAAMQAAAAADVPPDGCLVARADE